MAKIQFNELSNPALYGISLEGFLGRFANDAFEGTKYVINGDNGRRVEIDYYQDEFSRYHSTKMTFIVPDAQAAEGYAVIATVSDFDHLGIGDISLTDFVELDTIIGSSGNDQLSGNGYSVLTPPAGDILQGNGGDDVLTGYNRNDTLDGGTGNDIIRLKGSVFSSVDGGEGTDTIEIVWTGTYAFKSEGGEAALKGIERILFSSETIGMKIVSLQTDQIAGLSSNLMVEGVTQGMSYIDIVRKPGEAAVFDLSGWSFTARDPQHPPFYAVRYDLNESTGTFADRVIGTVLKDVIRTFGGADFMNGGDGDDELYAGTGADTVLGGRGDDVIIVASGDVEAGEVIDGGIGNDALYCSGDLRGATISGIERFVARGGAVQFDNAIQKDVIFDNDGNVPVVVQVHLTRGVELDASGWSLANWSADSRIEIVGSAGADRIVAPTFKTTILGGEGIDIVRFDRSQQASSIILDFGATGPEERTLQDGTVLKSVERFELIGGAARDILVGGAFADTLMGGGSADMLDGGAGDDRLDGGAGADLLDGGLGNDIYIVNGSDIIVDSGGIDSIFVTDSFSLAAIPQIENLTVQAATTGNAADLTGNALANTLGGNAGANALRGMDGDDSLQGLDGDDRLFGGNGKDVLSGGGGKDIFVFDTKPNKTSNADTIVDFRATDDTIWLDDAAFKGLKRGKLAKDAFCVGKKAVDAHDRIIYDKKEGALYYDPDGKGSAKQVLLATLADKALVSHLDFVIV